MLWVTSSLAYHFLKKVWLIMVGNDLSVYLYNHFLGKRLDIPSIIMLQDFVGISISKWVVINVFFFFFFLYYYYYQQVLQQQQKTRDALS